MAVYTYTINAIEPDRVLGTPDPRYFICDTEGELPGSGLNEGDLAYTVDSDKLWRATGSGTWTEVGGGGGGGGPHGDTHEDGGSDEIDVTGLSGLLADPQTPLPHATTHQHGGSDEVATGTPAANAIPKADSGGKLDSWISDATTTVKGKVELATDGEVAAGLAVQANDARLSNARTPLPHASTHKHGGSDEVATATPGANEIPKADSAGKLDAWISDASTTVKGKVELATDGESAANLAVQANDSRLTNARTPLPHALAGAEHTADTLANLNAKISDADVPALAGQLGGTPASPDVRGVRETGGPTLLTIGAIADGQFVRRSGTSLVGGDPGAASVNVKTTEQTFGDTPRFFAEWTIIDSDVTAASNILARLSCEPPAALRDGVAADGDEAEMEDMIVSVKNISAGSFVLAAEVRDGPVTGPYKFNYLVG